MRLLSSEDCGRHVAIFGSGLIGSAIDAALCNRRAWTARSVLFDWQNAAQRQEALNRISGFVEATAEVSRPHYDIVWAAGVNGFDATPDQMEDELCLIEELCHAASALAERCAKCSVTFHLVSSAGGLFEGKTSVCLGAEPAPLRSYGAGKLKQEQLVLSLAPRLAVLIYRPASVYGFRLGARRGLFATLVANGLSNKTTLINGHERTLRDYVSSRDVGDFVANRILAGTEGVETHLLASGKPTSMFEAIVQVERVLGRPIYRQFVFKAGNSRNLSFARNCLPQNFVPTPLEIGLASLKIQIQSAIIRNPVERTSGMGRLNPS